MRIDRLVREGRVRVTWLPFELRPDTPREGAPRRPRPAGEQASHLDQMAAEAGLVMKRRDRSINTRHALSTAEFARERGKFDEVHMALLRAHWETEDIWIDNVEHLGRIVAAAGLDPKELERALGEQRYEPLIDEYRAEAEAIGISAIPAHIVGHKYILLGAHPYETFIETLERIRAEDQHEEPPS